MVTPALEPPTSQRPGNKMKKRIEDLKLNKNKLTELTQSCQVFELIIDWWNSAASMLIIKRAFSDHHLNWCYKSTDQLYYLT